MTRMQQRIPMLASKPVAGFVNGDTGLKPTSDIDWSNVYLNAEPIAVVVPISEEVAEDADYDLETELMPEIVEAFGVAIDAAMLHGPNGTGKYHLTAGSGRPLTEWVERLARRARWVFAIGSCPAFGGFSASTPGNPLEACGLQYDGDEPGGLLGEAFVAAGGLPVVNIAGCPAHPGWVVDTLQKLALDGLTAGDLDECGRPLLYAEQLVHHGCSRNEYYEFKASAIKQSDLGCLMENLGCKGTQAHADCNVRTWNGSGSCLRGGFACTACTEPGFEAPGHPFQETPKVAGIPIGLPTDMPKAWFVALAALSKSATPKRVRDNAVVDHQVIRPSVKKAGK